MYSISYTMEVYEPLSGFSKSDRVNFDNTLHKIEVAPNNVEGAKGLGSSGWIINGVELNG